MVHAGFGGGEGVSEKRVQTGDVFGAGEDLLRQTCRGNVHW